MCVGISDVQMYMSVANSKPTALELRYNYPREISQTTRLALGCAVCRS